MQRRTAIPLRSARTPRTRREAPRGDLYTAWRSWASPSRSPSASATESRRLRRARHLPRRAQPRPDGRPARWLLGRIERGWAKRSSRVIRSTRLCRRDGGRWPVQRPLVVMNCSFRFTPPRPAGAPLPRALGLEPVREGRALPRRPVPVAGSSSSIEAIARARPRSCYGLRRPRADAEGLGGGPGDRWQGAGHGRRAARPAARLGRGRGRRRDADPGRHAQPPADHPEEALRGHGRGRAGRRVRPAGDVARSSTRPGRASSSTRPTPARSPTRSRGSSLPEAEWLAWRQRCLEAAHERYNWETQVEALLDRVRQAHGASRGERRRTGDRRRGGGRSSSSATRPTRTRGRSASGGRWPRTATTSRSRRPSRRARPNARRTARSSSAATSRAASSPAWPRPTAHPRPGRRRPPAAPSLPRRGSSLALHPDAGPADAPRPLRHLVPLAAHGPRLVEHARPSSNRPTCTTRAASSRSRPRSQRANATDGRAAGLG